MSKNRKTILFLLPILALAIAAGCLIISANSKKDLEEWESTRAAYLASGESLDRTLPYAKPVPDEQNFGAIPALNGINGPGEHGEKIRANLSDLNFALSADDAPELQKSPHKGHYTPADLEQLHNYFLKTKSLPVTATPPDIPADIYQAIGAKHGQLISQLLGAGQRPSAVFLPRLSTIDALDKPFAGLQTPPHQKSVKQASAGFELYAQLCMLTGDGERAIDSIATLVQLAGAAGADNRSLPTSIIYRWMLASSSGLIWDGLDAKSWNGEQLMRLQNIIESVDLRANLTDAFRSELVQFMTILDTLEIADDSGLSDGMFAELSGARLKRQIPRTRTHLLKQIDEGALRPLKSGSSYLEVRQAAERAGERYDPDVDDPDDTLIALLSPSIKLAVVQAAKIDTTLQQAATACALERYFLENRAYPDTLQSLVPKFAKEAPLDPMDNLPMRYKKTDDGRYQLYSIDWDGKDDNGEQGDITWNYLPPAEP